MGGDHLPDVTDGRTKGENAGANHRDETAVEARKGCNETGDREAETCGGDLELEGAPARE